MNDKEDKKALDVFKSLCETMDQNELTYTKNEEELAIYAQAVLEDLPIPFTIIIDKKMELIKFLSVVPFVVPEKRRIEMAVAVCQANRWIVDGSFDYNCVNGNLIFRMVASYHDSLIGNDLFLYMIAISLRTIDLYNDKFLAVSKNDMSIDEIVNFIK